MFQFSVTEINKKLDDLTATISDLKSLINARKFYLTNQGSESLQEDIIYRIAFLKGEILSHYAAISNYIRAGRFQVETATVSGTITVSGNVTAVVTATGLTGSPITVQVPVLGGTAQVETATVVGTIDSLGAGNVTVIVTAGSLTGSPLTVPVAVLGNDTASVVAGKIRTSLGGVAAITSLFTVGGTGANVSLTSLTQLANDPTVNISIANGTCTGLTDALTSVNSVAGILGDDASSVATKVRSALGGVTAITNFFSIGGAGSSIVLTALSTAANDDTMNLSIDNGTSSGLIASLTSTNTVSGAVD